MGAVVSYRRSVRTHGRRGRNGVNAFAICLVSFLLLGQTTGVQAKDANAQKGVTDVLNMQVEGWNHGDLEKFMTGYRQSPDTSYVSGGDEVWGYEALLKRYENR